MSNDTVEFPWRNAHETPLTVASTPSPDPSKLQNFITSHKTIIGCSIAALVLISMLSKNKAQTFNGSHGPSVSQQISVVVPVVAFPKGSVLDTKLLKPVAATTKSFTRVQLLSVFTEDDIERVGDQLIAKKDLAPYRPIFWNTLELKRAKPLATPKLQIFYPVSERNPK